MPGSIGVACVRFSAFSQTLSARRGISFIISEIRLEYDISHACTILPSRQMMNCVPFTQP